MLPSVTVVTRQLKPRLNGTEAGRQLQQTCRSQVKHCVCACVLGDRGRGGGGTFARLEQRTSHDGRAAGSLKEIGYSRNRRLQATPALPRAGPPVLFDWMRSQLDPALQ